MPDLNQLVMEAIRRNPNIAKSPQGQQFVQIIKSGDVEAGQQMARNICQSYGKTPEEMFNQATNFFFNI